MSNARYRIGIDLGTTNCVVSYLAAGETEPKLLDIPQFMADGTVRPSTRLPSAIYLLAKDEVGKIEPVLPWRGQATDLIVGHGALELGQRRSGQLIQSAKSWLSHRQVDRRQAILPWGQNLLVRLVLCKQALCCWSISVKRGITLFRKVY